MGEVRTGPGAILVLAGHPARMRGTKILATVGPASIAVPTLKAMLLAGANGFRLNYSHGSPSEHQQWLERIRRVARAHDEPVAIVGDLQGPKIRIGDLTAPRLVLADRGELTLDERPAPGTAQRIPVSLRGIDRYGQAGDPILLGDGSIELRVKRVVAGGLETEIVHGGLLTPHAGLYLPRARLRATVLGAKDRLDLHDAVTGGVDYIAVSFVRSAGDLRKVRREIDRLRPPRGAFSPVGLIAKIERAEALANIDEILDEADAIMVARGDLGIEVPLERLALEQKGLVRKANAAGKTVIVATQMLLSMVSSPRPTRAEATDVANAVLDGADAVMLSEESAVGQFPAESVAWLDRITRATEPSLEASRFDFDPDPSLPPEAHVAGSAVELAARTRSVAIATPTHSGKTARLVSRLRPPVPIWAFTTSEEVRRRLALAWGVRSYRSPIHQPLLDARELAVRVARAQGLGRGTLVLTAGYPLEGRPTNLVTLVELGPERAASGRRARAAPAARRGAGAGAAPR